ncbi:YHYH protein [Parasediminibacterium sp. JCM 36343]|uniref:YHYH protein n=1 Tax=Parasediminibacterium sp. JCM 36343 TaxID=3374279 RepID=UPI00397DDD38
MVNCKKSSDSSTPTTTTGDVDITSVVQAKFGNTITNAVTVSTSGSSIIIKSDGRPNHKSPYWGASNANYEAFQSGHGANPSLIGVQNYTMTIPAKPAAASTHEATSLFAIGMALNGVPIFNDQEGPSTTLDVGKISSLDKAGAHPAQSSDYHYHVTDYDGTYTTNDDAKLVGFLRDGFPIYGRKDKDGTYPSNLDAYNGHTGATTEFPNGIYHYHTRNENYLNTGYYILKSGSYYGTKGTFTQ